jgi:hypothetical protein
LDEAAAAMLAKLLESMVCCRTCKWSAKALKVDALDAPLVCLPLFRGVRVSSARAFSYPRVEANYAKREVCGRAIGCSAKDKE